LACTACRKRQKTAIGGQHDSSVTEARRPLVSSSAFGDQDGPSVFSFGGQDGPSAIKARQPSVSSFLLRIRTVLRQSIQDKMGFIGRASDLMSVSKLGFSSMFLRAFGYNIQSHACDDIGEYGDLIPGPKSGLVSITK